MNGRDGSTNATLHLRGIKGEEKEEDNSLLVLNNVFHMTVIVFARKYL